MQRLGVYKDGSKRENVTFSSNMGMTHVTSGRANFTYADLWNTKVSSVYHRSVSLACSRNV